MDIVQQTNEEENVFKRNLKSQLNSIQKKLDTNIHLANKDLIQNDIPLFVQWLNQPHVSKYFMDTLNHFIQYIKDMESLSNQYHISEKNLAYTENLENFLTKQTISYTQI